MGPGVNGLGGQGKECRLHLNNQEPSPLCYLPLSLVLSVLCLHFRRLEKREKKRKGGDVKGEGRKEERKRDIPVPFCWPHLDMLLLVSCKKLEI